MPPENTPDFDSQHSEPNSRPWWHWPFDAARASLAWSMASRLRAGLLFGVCLAAVAGVVCGWLVTASEQSAAEPATLEMALEALDEGAYAEARELAERFQRQATVPPEQLGSLAFVVGAAAVLEADDMPSSEARSCYLAASRDLEEARDRGFPPGRSAQGLYLLGRSLHHSGQYSPCRPILLLAAELGPENETEIHRLLASAYLNDANPQLDKALAENSLYLADVGLPREIRHQGLLERAQILLRLGEIDRCAGTLEEIPPDAENLAEVILMRGRVLMHQARAVGNRPDATAEDRQLAGAKYAEAITTLRMAQGRDTLGIQVTCKSIYLIGNCLLEMGDDRAALEQFALLEGRFGETPEALAANLREAELSRQRGREHDALICYRRVLRGVADPETFSNPWITLDQLRLTMLSAYEHYLDTQQYEAGLQLTREFEPLFPRVQTLGLMSEAYERWGDALLARAEEQPAREAEATRRQGRLQLRHAGRVSRRLAELESATRQFTEHLWKSANAYLRGQDFDNAVRGFEKYVENESQRRPRALVSLGEALLSLGRIDEALAAFGECIEYHGRDAAAFRARLLASRAYVEKGELLQAEALLRANLSEQYQTPASAEWRDSLFALGEVLHVQGRYAEAIRSLEEAVARYPEDPQSLAAQYRIACCHRQGAEDATKQLERELKGTDQVVYSRQIDASRTEALRQYRRVREVLSELGEGRELLPAEEAMLRNCYFAIGDVLYALRQYDAAVEAYRTLTNRYQDRPEVLEAYVRMAWTFRRLNRPLEARTSLEQAKVMLAGMKEDALFQETTNYSRGQWGERLDRLSNL